jgi:hypothetical protein
MNTAITRISPITSSTRPVLPMPYLWRSASLSLDQPIHWRASDAAANASEIKSVAAMAPPSVHSGPCPP